MVGRIVDTRCRIMTGRKKIIIIILAALFLLAFGQTATAQNVTELEKLKDRLEKEQTTLDELLTNFDLEGATERTENVSQDNKNYTVKVYQDKNGNILRLMTDPDGTVVEKKYISSNSGPVYTIYYNKDGTVDQTEVFEPIGLKKYTVTYDADGSKTEVVQDASQPSNNTLTIKLDKNGNIISEEISTTPGLPPDCTYCQNTGQYECNKSA